MLYFLKTEDYYKIGYTKDSGLESRLRSYVSHNPLVELLGIREGTRDDEKNYHTSFSKYDGTGEWFKLPKTLVNIIKKDFTPSDLLRHPNKRGCDSKNKNYYKKKRGNILQYSTDGTYINCFSTIKQAVKETGISYWSIFNYLNGNNKSGGGFIWKLEKCNK